MTHSECILPHHPHLQLQQENQGRLELPLENLSSSGHQAVTKVDKAIVGTSSVNDVCCRPKQPVVCAGMLGIEVRLELNDPRGLHRLQSLTQHIFRTFTGRQVFEKLP